MKSESDGVTGSVGCCGGPQGHEGPQGLPGHGVHTIVIYHANCTDGFTAAWCAWLTLGSEGVVYHPAHYGDAPPDVTGLHVYVLDFSYPRHWLMVMHGRAKSILVLDHHKTAAADLEGLPYAQFDMNRSGAGMAWDHFCRGGRFTRPNLVDYVQDRDLWRWELPSSKEVSAYIATKETDFDAWTGLAQELHSDLPVVVMAGRAALAVLEKQVKGVVKNARTYRTIGGFAVPVVNLTYGISETLNVLAEHHPFACAWFWLESENKFKFSLRSSKGGVDVSAIAKAFGGGGHRNAAGFTLDPVDFFHGFLEDDLAGMMGEPT